MNKLFVFLMASLLMVGVVNAAPGTPMPFVVIVDTFTPSDAVGMEVIVRDLTHPFTMILKTNENGEVAGDWANSPVRGEVGDQMEIVAGSKTINAIMMDYGLDIIHVNMIEDTKYCPVDTTPYNTDTCPIKETIKETIKEVPVEVIKYVDVIKEVPVEKIVYVEKTIEPKDLTNEYIISIVALIAVALGAYKGYYRLQIKKKKVSATGSISYVYATVFEKTSAGTKVTR